MSERLNAMLAKVERSKKHIVELQAEVAGFLATNPYVIGTKRNPETRQLIYYVTGVRETPVSLALIAGDVLQNLRSALDHLAHQLIAIGTGHPGPFPYAYFPISNDVAAYEAKKGGQIKGMRPDAVTAIDAVKPYAGGNDTLWRLHKLNQIDKHRVLITVGSVFQSVDLGGYGFRSMLKALPPDSPMRPALAEILETNPPQAFFNHADRTFPLKVGEVLFIDGPDSEVDEEMQFRFEVALSEPNIIDGEPLIESLQAIADVVGDVIGQFARLLDP
jgi:hypothetical protein